MSELLKRAIEERANVWEQMKAHLDTVEAEGREFTGEADETYSKMSARMSDLDKHIAELDSVEQRNRAADEVRDRYKVEPPKADEKPSDEDRLRKMISGEIRGGVDFKPEARVLSKLSAGAGLNTVPTSFYDQLQDHLIQNSAIRQSNVTVLTTDSGENLQVPKTTTHPTAAIITEGSSITASDAVFGQATLGAFKYAFSTQISTELETDTAVDLVGYLAQKGGEALGNGSGAHFVTGTGTTQPWGIVTRATLGVTGGAGVTGAFTADNLIDLFYSVGPQYRGRGTWMLQDGAMKALRKLKDTTNQYLWQPGLQAGEPGTFIGRPVLNDPNVATPALSAKSVVFGDFSTYFIRQVSGVRVERSVDFAFGTDLITWRFILRTDGELIDQTGAVKYFQGNAA